MLEENIKFLGDFKNPIIYDMIYIIYARGKYMDYDIEMNKKDYQREKEARAKRLEAYAEAIQTITLQKSSKVIEELIEERRRQGLTQQDLADMTGILAPNLARLESRKRVPTLVVLQKYASALGMHIEVKLCDGTEEEEKKS